MIDTKPLLPQNSFCIMQNAKQHPGGWSGGGELRVMARKDHVVELVRHAILTGQLKPGERIVELELSRKLGIGNNAVREALFELQGQGYVTRRANRGTFVTELTPSDAQQIFVVRQELEGLAAELAQGHLTDSDIRDLQRWIDAMEQAGVERDLQAFSEADLRFHQVIWSLSQNRFLEEALVNIVGPLFAVFVMRDRSVTKDQLLCSSERHRQILGALIQGAGSRQVMEDSLQYFLRQQMDTTFGSDSQNQEADETPGAATAATPL